MLRRSVLLGGFAFLLAACGAPRAEPVAPAAPVAPNADIAPDTPATTVVFLGDSLTAGLGLAAEDALPAQVEARWKADGYDARAINAGVSGDTTANGLARFDWSVASANPDIVVIALGANDFLLGLPAEQTRANLDSLLEKARDAGIRAVLVGLQPRGSQLPGTREAEFANIYPDLAEAFDVPLFPDMLKGVSDHPDLLQSDGLHPTAEGVRLIAGRLAPYLEPMLVPVN